jgi:adenylate kinase family enzyme
MRQKRRARSINKNATTESKKMNESFLTPKCNAFFDFAHEVSAKQTTLSLIEWRKSLKDDELKSFKKYLKIYYTQMNEILGHKSAKAAIPAGYESSL